MLGFLVRALALQQCVGLKVFKALVLPIEIRKTQISELARIRRERALVPWQIPNAVPNLLCAQVLQVEHPRCAWLLPKRERRPVVFSQSLPRFPYRVIRRYVDLGLALVLRGLRQCAKVAPRLQAR